MGSPPADDGRSGPAPGSRPDLTDAQDSTGAQRAGFAAIIGAPNAGKSTLVNRLTGTKVSIVTQKVQTTRFPVRGIAMFGASQIVLVDTPGIFTPRRRLDRAMKRNRTDTLRAREMREAILETRKTDRNQSTRFQASSRGCL